jgi:hypothetical protein
MMERKRNIGIFLINRKIHGTMMMMIMETMMTKMMTRVKMTQTMILNKTPLIETMLLTKEYLQRKHQNKNLVSDLL